MKTTSSGWRTSTSAADAWLRYFLTAAECPLLGVKWTLRGPVAMSAYDPRRTSDASSTIESRLFMSGAHHRILVFASNVFAAERHTRWQQGLAIARSAAMDKLRCPLLVKSGHFDHKARDIRFAPESGHQTTPPSCRSTALRSSPAVDHNVRIEPLRIENGPQGWTPYGPLLPQQIAMVNDLPSFSNTPSCIASVVRWCNTGSIRRCCVI